MISVRQERSNRKYYSSSVTHRQLRQTTSSYLFRESAIEIGLKSASPGDQCNIQAAKSASFPMDWLFFFFFPSINAQPALSCSAKGPSHLTGPAFLMRLSVLLTWKCPHQAGKSGGALEKTWHLITHVSSSVSPKQKLSTQTAQVSHTSFNHDF